MTSKERELINDLSKRIVDEKDPVIFHQLVEQLDQLLGKQKEKGLQNEDASQPSAFE